MYSFPKLSKLQQIQLPWRLTHKVSAYSAGDPGLIPGPERSRGKESNSNVN